MKELDELIEKYQNGLSKIRIEMEDFFASVPDLNLNLDILSQLDNDKLKKIEALIPRLNLTKEESDMIPKAFDYYYKNQGLNLNNLIIKDTDLKNFLMFIKDIYLKIIEYKNQKIEKYKQIKNKYNTMVKSINDIKLMLINNVEIDMETLVRMIRELNLSKELTLKILMSTLDKNLMTYSQVKVSTEVPETSINKETVALNIEENEKINYLELITVYLKKIDYFKMKIQKDNNYQEEKYICQAKLIKVHDDLKELKEDYEFCKSEPEYFKDNIIELEMKIKQKVLEVDNIIDNYEDSYDDNEVVEVQKGRDLIFLNSVMKDEEEIENNTCSVNIFKKLYKKLLELKYDEIIYEIPFPDVQSVNMLEIKSSLSNDKTLSIFYQILNDKVIIIMLGIAEEKDLKQSVESRIQEYEYKALIDALKLGKMGPNKVCPYNQQMTNLEYLNIILQNYKQRENDFFEKFHTEYYKPDAIKR